MHTLLYFFVCPHGAGADSRKKIPGARAAPKQAGSETLLWNLENFTNMYRMFGIKKNLGSRSCL